ncbi:uncharacterized protein [Dermacentor albipictus]|uniref:uncharacterized protein isoform X2 n=1 Tax=Dermacentor albipictus TaxID=60249 RepID=UPI0038FD1E1C
MRQPPSHHAGHNPPGYPASVPTSPGARRRASSVAVARAVAHCRRQSLAASKRRASAYGAPVPPFKGPRPPMALPGGAHAAGGSATGVLRGAAPIAQPVIAPVTAPGSAPGAMPGALGDLPVEDIEGQMLIEQALYELTQKPIIPNVLVFTCALCYLLFVGSALIIGSVYFTYRLKPATPPEPPAQTDTTVTFREGSVNNPIICLVEFLAVPNPDIVSKLFGLKLCDVYFMKEVLEFDSQGEMTLAGHTGLAAVDTFLTESYGTHSGVLNAHQGEIHLSGYCPDSNLIVAMNNDVLNLMGFYLRLRAGWSDGDAVHFLDELYAAATGTVYMEVQAADIPKVTTDMQRYFTVLVVVPPAVHKDSLEHLKVATLANPFRHINDTLHEATKLFPNLKICAAFTMAALKSASAAGKIDKPGDPADSVTPVKQSEVCNLLNAKEDKKDISMYIAGAPFYSFDTNKTMFEKVRGILTQYNQLCLGAINVLHDDCLEFALLKMAKTVFDKNFD